MSIVREWCGCGARLDLVDVPFPNALAVITAWRESHNCKLSGDDGDPMFVDVASGVGERSLGFAREVPYFEDDEERKR